MIPFNKVIHAPCHNTLLFHQVSLIYFYNQEFQVPDRCVVLPNIVLSFKHEGLLLNFIKKIDFFSHWYSH